MTVNMGTVWDRATEFLSSTARGWWPVALLAIFVPRAIGDVAQLASDTLGQGAAQGIALAAVLIALWGQLVIVALALDPERGIAAARRIATGGFGRAVLVMLVLFVAVMVLIGPVIGTLVASGMDLTQLAGGTQASAPDLSGGAAVFLGLYGLALCVVVLFVGARLVPLYPVILAEARGPGAITRSFAITRGLTWKLVGVLILFCIVLAVAAAAARSVAGVIVGLIFPASGAVTPGAVAGALAGALVTTIFSVIVAAYSAKLYRAVAAAPAGAVDIA